MRAWRVWEYGEPEQVLRLEDVPSPEPGPDEIRVAVEFAALNFADGLLCLGRYQEKPPFPFTPGAEAAGVVEALGAGVDSVRVGDRVAVLPKLGHGAFAESTIAEVSDVFVLPSALPVQSAAALLVTYQTAYVALMERCRLRPGATVLVHAGAGGAGSAAIQVAKAAGATVFATAGGTEKTRLVHELGADVAIDYRADDFVAAINNATDGRGVDIVYDGVGGDTFDASTKVVGFEGIIVVVGFSGGRIADAATNHAMVKNYSIVGVNWGAYRIRRPEVLASAHAWLTRAAVAGVIAPLIGEVIDFATIPAALGRLRDRATVGKIIVEISGGATHG